MILRIFSLFHAPSVSYCTGRVNSRRCKPAIGLSDWPSASSAPPSEITATNVINRKNGLLFYGYDASTAAFQRGTLCVEVPTKRKSVQQTGGSATGSDCIGSDSYDFDPRVHSGVVVLL